MHRYIPTPGFIILLIVLSCTVPQDPRNPSNAKIAGQTIENIPDEFTVTSTFTCSVTVSLPEFIDSFGVLVEIDEQEGETVAGGAVEDDTVYQFDLTFPEPGEYTITLYLYRNTSVIDSFIDTRTVQPLVSNETVSSLPDSIPVRYFYSCTVSVHYPECIDSFAVIRSDEKGEYSSMSYAGTVAAI